MEFPLNPALLLLATKCTNLTEVKNEVLALQPGMDFG
jgi:hypothetical protein